MTTEVSPLLRLPFVHQNAPMKESFSKHHRVSAAAFPAITTATSASSVQGSESKEVAAATSLMDSDKVKEELGKIKKELEDQKLEHCLAIFNEISMTAKGPESALEMCKKLWKKSAELELEIKKKILAEKEAISAQKAKEYAEKLKKFEERQREIEQLRDTIGEKDQELSRLKAKLALTKKFHVPKQRYLLKKAAILKTGINLSEEYEAQLKKIEEDLKANDPESLSRFYAIRRKHPNFGDTLSKWNEEVANQRLLLEEETKRFGGMASAVGACSSSPAVSEATFIKRLATFFSIFEDFQDLVEKTLKLERTDLNELKSFSLTQLFDLALLILIIYVTKHKAVGSKVEFNRQIKSILTLYHANWKNRSERTEQILRNLSELSQFLSGGRKAKFNRYFQCMRSFQDELNSEGANSPLDSKVKEGEASTNLIPFTACIPHMILEIALRVFSHRDLRDLQADIKRDKEREKSSSSSSSKTKLPKDEGTKEAIQVRKVAEGIVVKVNLVLDVIASKLNELQKLAQEKMTALRREEELCSLYLHFKPLFELASSIKRQLAQMLPAHTNAIKRFLSSRAITSGFVFHACTVPFLKAFFKKKREIANDFLSELSHKISELTVRHKCATLKINIDILRRLFLIPSLLLKLKNATDEETIKTLNENLATHEKFLFTVGFSKEFLDSFIVATTLTVEKILKRYYSDIRDFHHSLLPLKDPAVMHVLHDIKKDECSFLIEQFDTILGGLDRREALKEEATPLSMENFFQILSSHAKLSLEIEESDEACQTYVKTQSTNRYDVLVKVYGEETAINIRNANEELNATLLNVLADLEAQMNVFTDLIDAFYTLIGRNLEIRVGGWEKFEDLEFSFAETQETMLEDPIFDPEPAPVAKTGKKKKKKASEKPAKPPTKAGSAPVAFASSSSSPAKVTAVVTGKFSPFKVLYDRFLAEHGLKQEVLPSKVTGTVAPGSSRIEEARFDQRFALHCLDVSTELLGCSDFYNSKEELTPLGTLLLDISGLFAYLAIERRYTAAIYERSIRCLLEHNLIRLRRNLGKSTTGHPFLTQFQSALLEFRYPDSLAGPKMPLLKDWDLLLRDFLHLMQESLSEEDRKVEAEGEWKEFASWHIKLNKEKIASETLPASVIKELSELESVLQSRLKLLQEKLSTHEDGEGKKILLHVVNMFNLLRFTPQMISHISHQRYLVLPTFMLRMGITYLCRNLGLYRRFRNGHRNVVYGMGSDLHHLKAYCKPEDADPSTTEIYLDTPLRVRSTSHRMFLALMKEGKPEYPYDLQAEHVLGTLLGEAYEWSLAAVSHGKKEGVWALRSRTSASASPEKLFEDHRSRLINRVLECSQLAEELISYHVFDIEHKL